jgi:hypothetical protein
LEIHSTRLVGSTNRYSMHKVVCTTYCPVPMIASSEFIGKFTNPRNVSLLELINVLCPTCILHTWIDHVCRYPIQRQLLIYQVHSSTNQSTLCYGAQFDLQANTCIVIVIRCNGNNIHGRPSSLPGGDSLNFEVSLHSLCLDLTKQLFYLSNLQKWSLP